MISRAAIVGLVAASPLLFLMAAVAAAGEEPDPYHARVKAILTTTPLIDGHNDIPYRYKMRVDNHLERLDFGSDLTSLEKPTDTDLPRMRDGMVGGQFWSVYIPIKQHGGAPGDASRVLDQIDLVNRLVARYPDDLAMAYTAEDIVQAHKQGKIASLIGMEGGHAIENSLATLRMMHQAGARYMTLTHGKGLRWADSATDEPRLGGLSPFGKEVVREMNRLGMLVDLSHVSPDSMHNALDVSEAPVIFSHSNAYAVTANPRNVPDDVLLRLKDNNGVIMITFFPAYCSTEASASFEAGKLAIQKIKESSTTPEETETRVNAYFEANPPIRPTLNQVADHIDYVRDLIGIDHIGIGADYDGMPPGPIGLEDVSTYPALFSELLRRGYSDEDVAKIAGKNILRVMREAEAVSKTLKSQREPSDVLIDEVDGEFQESPAS
ncbi:MAG: dipeptidase [Halieaceae bacterium]